MKLSELCTFEEVKQYANDIIELFDLFYDQRENLCWRKIPKFNHNLQIQYINHGVEGYEWCLCSNGEKIGVFGFYRLDLGDGNWVDQHKGLYSFYTFPQDHHNTFDIFIGVGKTTKNVEFLPVSFINEDMYVQLEFLYPIDVVNCIVLQSILNATKKQIVYFENERSPRELIDILKLVTCTHSK